MEGKDAEFSRSSSRQQTVIIILHGYSLQELRVKQLLASGTNDSFTSAKKVMGSSEGQQQNRCWTQYNTADAWDLKAETHVWCPGSTIPALIHHKEILPPSEETCQLQPDTLPYLGWQSALL